MALSSLGVAELSINFSGAGEVVAVLLSGSLDNDIGDFRFG